MDLQNLFTGSQRVFKKETEIEQEKISSLAKLQFAKCK